MKANTKILLGIFWILVVIAVELFILISITPTTAGHDNIIPLLLAGISAVAALCLAIAGWVQSRKEQIPPKQDA